MAAAMLCNQFREKKNRRTSASRGDFKEMQELQSSRSCDNQQKWEQARKTRRWLDFSKYILSWHASIV
ncbi:unnamed protein product [Sphagnum compactum]